MTRGNTAPSDEGRIAAMPLRSGKTLFFGFFLTGAFISRLVAAGADAIDYFFAAFFAR